MNKPLLKLCVLALSFAAIAVLGTSSAAAETAQRGGHFDLMGMTMCLGEVQSDIRCDVRVPLPQQETSAPHHVSAGFGHNATTKPVGAMPFDQCHTTLPAPLDVICDLRTVGNASLTGAQAALEDTGWRGL